jgi:hypothetical protein
MNVGHANQHTCSRVPMDSAMRANSGFMIRATAGDWPMRGERKIETWRNMTDSAEIRRQIIASLDAKRDLLGCIDDTALVEIAEHLRALIPNDPDFNPAAYLAEWLWDPMRALGGLTPAQVLLQEGSLERLKLALGQQVAGVYL